MKKYGLLLFIVFSFLSCYDNQIIFDVQDQKIVSCNGQIITTMTIEKDDGDEHFFIEKKDGYKGESDIYLNKIDDAYFIETLSEELSSQDFKLSPNSSYVLRNHTFGDAASSEVRVKTDGRGHIIYASKTGCKD